MTAEAMTPASLSDLIADVKSLATSAAAGDDATIPLSDDEVQELGKGILKLLDALQASQPCGAAGDVTREQIAQVVYALHPAHDYHRDPLPWNEREGADSPSMVDPFAIADAILALRSQPTAQGWQPIETAPKDGTLVQLLIKHENEADGEDCGGGFDDNDPSRSMGFNNFDNDGEDRWKFPGWDWCQDYIVEQGCGRPIMWAPMLPLPAPPQPGKADI